MKITKKKSIGTVLTVVLIITGVCTTFIMAAKAISKATTSNSNQVQKEAVVYSSNTNTDTDTDSNNITANSKVTDTFNNANQTNSSNNDVIYKSKRTYFQDPNTVKDKYHIGKEEIEKFLSDGYSVKDILEADDIGNQNDIDPAILLSRKQQENKSLNTIKEEILKEKTHDIYAKVKGVYAKEFKQFEDENLDENDQMVIFSYTYDNAIDINKNLIKEYKKGGRKALENSAKKYKDNVLQKLKQENNISDADAEGLTGRMILDLKQNAKDSKQPLTNVLNKYKKKKKVGGKTIEK
jgi:hypothetical protein